MVKAMKSKKAAKATKAAVARKANAKAAATKRLQDKDDLDEMKKGAQRAKKGKRTIDEATEKAVADNFPGWTVTETHVNKLGIEGTVFDQVKRDKLRKLDGEDITMGKTYYNDLRIKNQDPNSPLAQMQVEDDSQEMDESLEAAIMDLLETKRCLILWHDWCENVADVNQRNFAAAAQQVLKTPPMKNLDNAQICLSFLRLILRLGLHEKFKKYTDLMHDHLDYSVVKELLSYKAQGKTSYEWWCEASDYASHFAPRAETEVCFKQEGKWTDCQDQLRKVTASSFIGARLFGRALKQIDVDRGAVLVDRAIASLEAEARINKPVLATNRAGFLRSMKDEGMDANSRFPKVRIFDMKYRGSPSPAPCISHLDYYTSAVESRCRAWLVENGKVKKMWCEDQLAEREPVQKDISDACISKGGKLVRQTLADSLDDDEASAVSIMALMKKKRSWMDSNDRFSKIERGFWEAVTGTMAQSRLEGKVIGCFPTPPLRKKDSEILANFESINTSQLLYFCGASSKSWWTTVYGYMKAICAGTAPGLEKAKESDFMTKFQECLKNQCEFEEAAGSDGAAGTLYGQAAIAKHYEAVKAKMQDAEAKLVYKDIKEVIKFGWALTPSERQSVAKALTLAGPKGKNADEKDAKAKSPAVKKAADDKKALVRSLFMKRSPP